MMKYEVKKLGVGGVLDQSIAVLRDHFGVLVATSLVVYLPLALINVIATNVLQPQLPTQPPDPSKVPEFYEALLTPLIPLIPLWLIIAFVVSPLSFGAVHPGRWQRGIFRFQSRVCLPILAACVASPPS